MSLVVYFLIFMAISSLFERLIEKTNFADKVVSKIKRFKHFKSILFSILIVFGFSIEMLKESLNERFSQHNLVSLILSAILFSIYVKFGPFVFQKKKS